MESSPYRSYFPSLAVELIELICREMELSELLQLRLTCGDLQRQTFHHFARRFFSTIKTDLSEESLSRINSIAQHKELRDHVHGLAFVLATQGSSLLAWERHPWGPLAAPMEMEVLRRLRDNLLNRLTNCRSFFIFCRYPEGRPDLSRVTMSDAVAVFFELVVDSSLPVSSFHLVYANRYSHKLTMDMRRLPKLLYRQPAFRTTWCNLRKLSLEQYLTLDNFGFLLELVLSAPNLKTLLLNLGSHDLAAEFIHELAESASFSQLEEFALFRTASRAADLNLLLDRIRTTVKTLTFYHVSLPPSDHWTSVLKSLSQHSLNSISLYYLWSSSSAKELLSFPDLNKAQTLCGSGQRVHMFYSENSKSPACLGVEYSGPSMSEVLGMLMKTAIYA